MIKEPELPDMSDATYELAVEKFKKLHNFKGHISDFIKLNYEVCDLIFNDVFAPKLECKKGCSHCCHVPVLVTAVEAFYIQEKTGIEANIVKRKKEKCRVPDGSPCPFLKNDACSIYEYRPIACRTFGSFDGAEACAKGGEHFMININSSDAFKECATQLAMQSDELMKKKHARYSDIRDWFND